jgi:hypothetical protein
MNKTDVQVLQSVRSYPAVSILMPTHRTSPDNRQDPIRLRNLVATAQTRLLKEFPKRDIEPLLARLDALVAQVDYPYMLDGLALYANKDMAVKYYLPFYIKERVVIDETFATRDLVLALNRAYRYWVLVLSEQPTRLFEGARDTLVEVTEQGFPMVHQGPGGETALPGGQGVRKSAHRDERHRQFFRQVDEAFGKIAKDDPLPLVLVGVDRYLSFFPEVSQNKKLIMTTLTGSHDKTSSHELSKLVWPLVKANMDDQQNKALGELATAVSAGKYASTIGEAWRIAQEGRADTLLVEEDFHYPARLDETGKRLLPADDPTIPDVIDDAVDELIETVLAKKGRVVFVDNGALEAHQRIAMILRY